jgi:hypothetical protein
MSLKLCFWAIPPQTGILGYGLDLMVLPEGAVDQRLQPWVPHMCAVKTPEDWHLDLDATACHTSTSALLHEERLLSIFWLAYQPFPCIIWDTAIQYDSGHKAHAYLLVLFMRTVLASSLWVPCTWKMYTCSACTSVRIHRYRHFNL